MLSKKKKQFIVRLWGVQLFVLIPILLATILVSNKYIENMEQVEAEQLRYRMEDVTKLISTDFYEYVNKGVSMFTIREFSAKNPFLEAESALRALNLLHAFSIFNDEQICVYYGNDRIYYAAGMESGKIYFHSTLNCTEESAQRGIKALESDERAINILNTKHGDGYLMYHIPIDNNALGYSRSMQVYVSLSSFANKMKSVLRGGEKLLTISIGDGCCYFYDDGESIEETTLDALEQLQKNSKWVRTEVRDSELNLSVTALYNMEKQLSGAVQLRNISIWILIIGMFTSAAVAFLLSAIRFSRLSNLLSNVVNKNAVIKKKENNKYKNEYDYIIDAFEVVEGHKKTIFEKNNALKKILLQHISIKIFQGMIRNLEEIQNVLDICGVKLFEDFYYLLGIVTDSEEQINKINTLLSADISYFYQNECVLILGEMSSFDYDMTERKKIVEILGALLENNNICVKQIIVSRVFYKKWPIDFASLDVINILESGTSRRKPVVFWEDWMVSRANSVSKFDENELKEFQEAINSRNINYAEAVINNMIGHTNVQDKEDKIYKRFKIVRMLEDTLCIYDKKETKRWFMEELAYIDLHDEAAFLKKITKILEKHFEEEEKEVLICKILKIIEENCFKYDLSLEMLAEQTGVSKSWISKNIKNKVGMNYTEYINKLRIDRAKELLINTDMSIGEIFVAVGYVDDITARRNFKKYIGLTPSEYCQKYKDDRKMKGE
ncbi:MAG: helix-turn-helix transcriptional regulator [Lachnospiraceae bacterium]|nr:helix-turn-helix transcriptional regulator [Lachnospiraceae bacterium]